MQEKEVHVQQSSKKTIGVLLGLFTGLIGLVIGLLLYKDGTPERETFMKGWTIGFVVDIVLAVILGIVVGIWYSSMINALL